MTEGSSRLLAKYFPGSSRAMPRLPDILDRWIKHQENNLAAKGALAVRIPLVVYQENGRLVARSLSGAECSLLVLEEQRTRTMGELDICQGLGLTHREVEVLSWVAHGKTNADIAIILAMSPRTVEKHLERVFQKLGVETRTAAAACLMRKCHSSNLLRMNQNIE